MNKQQSFHDSFVAQTRIKESSDRTFGLTIGIAVAIIGGITAMRDLDDWLADLEPAGVPSGPINTIDRVFDDPQILARGMRVKIPHALGIDVEYAGNPIRFSASPVDYPRAAPLLGEHSGDVLEDWLGLDETAIQALRQNGVV